MRKEKILAIWKNLVTNIIISIGFTVWLNPFFANGEIIQTSSFIPIKFELNKANSSTLIIISLENTLLINADEILKPHNLNNFRKYFKKYITIPILKTEKNTGRKKIKELANIINSQAKLEILDPKLVQTLKEAQINNVKILALTNYPERKLKILKENEIDFFKTWPDLENKIFRNFNRNLPEYRRGILYSVNLHKSAAIEQFIKYSEKKFEKIIVIDSNRITLENFELLSLKMKIPITSFEYTKYNFLPRIQINKAEIKKQFEKLIEKKVWE